MSTTPHPWTFDFSGIDLTPNPPAIKKEQPAHTPKPFCPCYTCGKPIADRYVGLKGNVPICVMCAPMMNIPINPQQVKL